MAKMLCSIRLQTAMLNCFLNVCSGSVRGKIIIVVKVYFYLCFPKVVAVMLMLRVIYLELPSYFKCIFKCLCEFTKATFPNLGYMFLASVGKDVW